jgi:hypothetical protein
MLSGLCYDDTVTTLQQRGGDAVTTIEADDELVRAVDAARILGVQRSTIKRYEERGKLTPARVDYAGLRRYPLFRRKDVEALRPESPSSEV